MEGRSVNEEKLTDGLSEEKHARARAIDQMAIGSIISVCGTLLVLKQAGMIAKDISTLPFVLLSFGMLLIFGSIYQLTAREKTSTG
jgi:hypothetical protein